MLNDLGRRESTETSGGAMILPPRQADKEASGKEIAGSGYIDHPIDRLRRHGLDVGARYHDATLFAARHHRKLGLGAHRFHCAVEVGSLVQTVQLALVGKDDINGTLANEIEKFHTIAVDAERIGQSNRNLATRLVCDAGSLDEGLLGLRRIPKIAF